MAMPNIRFGYSVKKNSFKGLDIDCIQYSNIIRITYYSYSYSGTILNPNIIRIRIRPNIFARILFVFIFVHSEKTNIICIRIWSNSDAEYYSYSYSVKKTVFAHLCCQICSPRNSGKERYLRKPPFLTLFVYQNGPF